MTDLCEIKRGGPNMNLGGMYVTGRIMTKLNK